MAGTPLAWSPDGRWIAFGADVIPAAGGKSCQPFGPGADDLGWAPAGGRMAGKSKVGAAVLGASGGRPQLVLKSPFAEQSFDPSGTRVAVSTLSDLSVRVVDLRTGKRRLLYRSPSDAVGPPSNERWSPDGRWVLFETDGYSSASIAADGLPLLAVRARGGPAIRIERRVLRSQDFVQPCGSRSIVISAGFDRYVSANKRVDIASPPRWKPVHVSHDKTKSWYSATCSPDGKLVAATATTDRDEGAFDSVERSIWLLAADGSSRRLLVGKPGDGLSDEAPRWSQDGRSILYVEHPNRSSSQARVYVIDVDTGRRRGSPAQFNIGLGYYGLHDWDGLMPWYQP
jgi:Tol biopolymer transport system component